ncbi:MAG TPA: hypothetical protein VGS79_26185 [Puia sp.]|nr:hypothetical protein [Puia sp.]
MDKKIKEMHLHAIKKQFEAAGFSTESIKRFLDEFAPDSGRRASWSFEMSIHETKVKGKVYAEPNMPGGIYALDFYQLTMAKRRAREKQAPIPAATNKFVCTPWSWVRLDEAVNLMQGRYVYRKPDMDPTGEGYWLYLTAGEPLEGFHRLGFIRTRFDVSNYLAETGLGGWLGLNGWVRLVAQLESGSRCDLVIGTGAGMRALKVEADPRNHRLALFDLAGHILDPEKLMTRKHPHPNPHNHAPHPDPAVTPQP